MISKECVIYEGKICDNCGECDFCDLNPLIKYVITAESVLKMDMTTAAYRLMN